MARVVPRADLLARRRERGADATPQLCSLVALRRRPARRLPRPLRPLFALGTPASRRSRGCSRATSGRSSYWLRADPSGQGPSRSCPAGSPRAPPALPETRRSRSGPSVKSGRHTIRQDFRRGISLSCPREEVTGKSLTANPTSSPRAYPGAGSPPLDTNICIYAMRNCPTNLRDDSSA